MANAYDYVNWKGDLTLEQLAINEVDIFLCSQLATPDYTEILPEATGEMTIHDAAERYFETHDDSVRNLGLLQSKYVLPAFKQMGQSIRFRDAVLCGNAKRVIPDNNEQFEAITIRLNKDLIVVSYRGTDDTIIGWKEDCLMAVMDQVPAQADALYYLEQVSAAYPDCKIVVTGHSKGGNLAIYAAAKASPEIQERILFAIGFDSPGFRDGFIESEGYLNIKDRTYTVLSQNAIVGTLLNLSGDYVIVHTDIFGPMAHDGFNWDVEGTSFVREKELSDFSLALGCGLYEVLSSMSDKEKVEFINGIFDTLNSTGAGTLTQLSEKGLISSIITYCKLKNNKEVKSFVEKVLVATQKSGDMIDEIREAAKRIYGSTHTAS